MKQRTILNEASISGKSLHTGDEVTVQAGATGIRFLLISGTPLEEPVAWRGPIVMNTHQELEQAFRELQDGTFTRRR